MGTPGLVSEHSTMARWLPPRHNTTVLIGENADVADIEHHLPNARHDHAQSQQARAPRWIHGLSVVQ